MTERNGGTESVNGGTVKGGMEFYNIIVYVLITRDLMLCNFIDLQLKCCKCVIHQLPDIV